MVTIESRKGQDIFVKAVYSLSPEIARKCGFIILGENSDNQIKKTDNLLNKYPENAVYIKSFKRDKIKLLYRQIDCLVCSSLDDPAPTVMAEAMVSSVSIICSENTGFYQMIEEYNVGLIYHNNDYRKLANCLEKMVNSSKSEREHMTKNAPLLYEKFLSKEVFSRNLASAIKDVMDI